jgi:curved DNA-binding protein CbpA
MESYYDILGVNKNSSIDEIKRAYRNLALKYHPDLNPNNRNAEMMFRKINQAYSILSNAYSRSQYDLNEKNSSKEEKTDDFTNEQALYQFMNTMYAYAAEMTMQNVDIEKIASFLESKGCPHNIATEIAHMNEAHRKAIVRKAASRLFLKATISVVAGIALTAFSYNLGTSTYVIFYGLILYGAWNIIKAIYYLLTGRAPKSDNNRQHKEETNFQNHTNQSNSSENLYNPTYQSNKNNNKASQHSNNSDNGDISKDDFNWRLIVALVFLIIAFVIYQTSKQTGTQSQQPSQVLVRINQDLNIRSGPGAQYDIIAVYRSGAIASVIGTYNNWYKVNFELDSKSYTGWINGTFTSRY